jgi:hypothetical protein
MIFGDFRYFLIVDRIGMTVELVPASVWGDEPAADRCAWPARLLAEHEPCPVGRGVQGARHHLIEWAAGLRSRRPLIPSIRAEKESGHG